MSEPFKTFKIHPFWGMASAAIEWELSPSTPSGSVFFYRSETGTKGTWLILNQAAPATGTSGLFQDSSVPRKSRFTIFYYRAVVVPTGAASAADWIKGPAVTALEELSRREYFLVRKIIQREWLNMRAGNGLPCWHFIPKTRGTTAANVDPKTGQILGPSCATDGTQGYGEEWAGGFNPPVATLARFLSLSPEDTKAREDMTGETEMADVKFRLLAFPKPAMGHLLAFPASDRRFALTEPVERYYFKGVTPVAWECIGKPLDARDLRSRLELPEFPVL